jgi:methylated-DNA-[protein]-cysteine S-methyltransferase
LDKNSYDIFETSWGWVGVLASQKGLMRTTLPQSDVEGCIQSLGPGLDHADYSPRNFTLYKRDLRNLYDGRVVNFDHYPIDIEDGPPFYSEAWSLCRLIPLGETRSYGWIASKLDCPYGARAVGQAMARNRLPIIIPCHRVISGSGNLGGYGQGYEFTTLKKWLLDLEERAVEEGDSL